MQYDIGILAGSGPEAGADMWLAILDEWRDVLGARFRGDEDAPSVLICSDPRLGASMDMESNIDVVRSVVLEHAPTLNSTCRAWVIACNTINRLASDIVEADSSSTFVSFGGVIESTLDRLEAVQPGCRIALLGARPVAMLGAVSPYAALVDRLMPLDEPTVDAVHQLILDIKRLGPNDADLGRRLSSIAGRIDADQLLLACTELPLVASEDSRAIDATRLVAAHIVRHVADRTMFTG